MRRKSLGCGTVPSPPAFLGSRLTYRIRRVLSPWMPRLKVYWPVPVACMPEELPVVPDVDEAEEPVAPWVLEAVWGAAGGARVQLMSVAMRSNRARATMLCSTTARPAWVLP